MKQWLLSLALLSIVVGASAQPLPPPGGNGSGVGSVHDLSLPGSNVPGRAYGPIVTVAPVGTAVGAANRLMALPVYVRPGSVLKTLSFSITTGNAAAWNARVCLYADTGQGLPGALLSDPGTVAVGSGSVTGVQTATIAAGGIAVGGAWYWVTFMADSASESVLSAGNAAAGPISSSRIMGWGSIAFAAAGTPALGVYAAQTFGACPSNFPAPTYADNLALPYVIMGY